ncbi:putative autophagy-related protein 11 [Mytilus edulis]|uniref:putative autophagy-related protein 11 n=1 Tax=Mytilus edulis TaxID=6550 RepID=UPI0039EF723F
MATSSPSCGVCDLRHNTKPSIVWCTECDEGLCTECQEHHSLSKASRNHNVIPINEYQKLPIDVLKITQYCSIHDEKFQIYCQKHECPCCSKCVVESHKLCQDIVNLDDVIQNAKTSNALSEIEETLVEVTENLQKIRHHQQNNQSTLKEKRKEIEKEIKKTRMKINSHLDKLQEDLMKQLYGLEEKENSKICQLLSSLDKNQKEIAECQTKIGNIKTHATDLQMLLSMRQIEKDVYSKEKFLQSLVEGEHLKMTFLSYKINTSIQNIMSNIISFGEVHMESKSCDILLIKKKEKQAQMMVPTAQSRSIENIKLTEHKTINTQEKYIYGCCMLPDCKLAFTYYNEQRIKVFNNKGSKDFVMKMPCNPFDVVYNSEDNTLAVTSGWSEKKCITIIDLERKQIKKTISLDSYIYGIALKDNRLIYSAEDKGIRMVKLSDESISDVVREPMPSQCYVATFRDNIYHTNRSSHAVTCYNLQGDTQWKFLNESVLKSPYGIDVDSDGNVYVVGFNSNNLVVISPDGQRHREILTASDGLCCPTSLYISQTKNQLLVANYINKAHLFNIV